MKNGVVVVLMVYDEADISSPLAVSPLHYAYTNLSYSAFGL
jgi:hypothetical protein